MFIFIFFIFQYIGTLPKVEQSGKTDHMGMEIFFLQILQLTRFFGIIGTRPDRSSDGK